MDFLSLISTPLSFRDTTPLKKVHLSLVFAEQYKVCSDN